MKKSVKLTIFWGILVLVSIIIFVDIFCNSRDDLTLKSSSPKGGQNKTTTEPYQSGDTISSGLSKMSKVTNSLPSPDYMPGTKFAPKGLTVANNTFVFDSREVDLNDDGTTDDIVLIGDKQDINNPYIQNISVAVKDRHTGKFAISSIGELNSGLDPRLFIGSFASTKKSDILTSQATGGSGGVYQYALLTYKRGQVTSLIPQKDLNQGLLLETQCLPGFKLKVTDTKTGYATIIDLKKGSDDYEQLGIYELHGIQSISVAAHVNTVAKAESVWGIRNGRLELLEETVEALQ